MATPILPLVDRILEGKTAEILRKHRSAGLSYEAIARRMDADYGIEVTGETVRKWCADADRLAPSDAEASA